MQQAYFRGVVFSVVVVAALGLACIVFAADTVPPTVNMTAPLQNAVISGTAFKLTATASDNVKVVGVQFILDGTTNINNEDTSSPYSTTLDTTTLSNGAHAISARAR